MWHSTGLTSPITYLLPAPLPSSSTSTSPQTFAVAYTDGSIRLWSFDPAAPSEPTEIVTFNGHKKTITHLVFDQEGSRLASGGTEGEIVLWDRIAEVGLFRLKGHRAPITGLEFIPHPTLGTTSHAGFLLSTAKDGYLKVWDLSTQHCVQTVVVGKGEVCSLAVTEEGAGDEDEEGEGVSGRWVLLTGSGDGEAKGWVLDKAKLAKGMAENDQGEVSFQNSSYGAAKLIVAARACPVHVHPPAPSIIVACLADRFPPEPAVDTAADSRSGDDGAEIKDRGGGRR